MSLDDENRQTLLTYQKKFRDIRDLAESKKFELKYIEPSLSSLFEKLEESFIEINNLFSCAHYQEAQEKFPELKRVIDASTCASCGSCAAVCPSEAIVEE